MKQKWMMCIASLCMAAILCIPVYAEEPEITPIPEPTVETLPEVMPEVTEAPAVEATQTPVPTASPEVSDAPEDEPAGDTTPEATEDVPESEATEVPETSSIPEASPEATVTVMPEVTIAPETTAEPEVSATPEISSELVHGDFILRINEDDTLTLTDWIGEEESASIPDEVEGLRVVSIGSSAFKGKKILRSVTVPSGVTAIESGAFSGCSALEEVNLPDSLEHIGGLFDDCGSLKTVRLNIANEIVTTGAHGYTRDIVEIIDEVEHRRSVTVSIDHPFTDFRVLDGGHWHVEGAMLIEKEHEVSVSPGGKLTVAQTGSITVMGALICEGSVAAEGSIVACAGDVSGVENVAREHSWLDGECSVCGEQQIILLDVDVLRSSFEKTYDGTSGIDVSAEDFVLLGVLEGDDVAIAAINSDFNQKDAGSYLANVTFVLAGEDAGRYAVKFVEIAVTIHPKRVTVTPRSGQGKVYGEKDPALSAGYKGTVNGETLQGTLSREKGEAAGKYQILSGTLDRLNPNYDIALSEAYFVIERKPISASSIKVGKVSNQRQSGSAIEPSVEIRDGSAKLGKGVDYSLSYSNNVSVGTAKIEIAGMGNYSGSRSVAFQIIKVSSGSSDSSLPDSSGTGVSLAELNDFGSAGNEIDGSIPVSTDVLTVGESEFGHLLFGAEDAPLSFIQTERMLEDAENLYSIMTITAQKLLNDFDIPLEGEYGQPRVRFSLEMVRALQEAGYTHVELVVGESEMRIPLDTLYAEFVSEEGTLSVDYYEVQLWTVKDEELTDLQRVALESRTLTMQPVHFELLAVPKAEGEEIAEPVDVLGLLDGVQLLFVPEAVPDYEKTSYAVLRMAEDAPDVQHDPAAAMFILDGEQVKCNHEPLFGGIYALVEE